MKTQPDKTNEKQASPVQRITNAPGPNATATIEDHRPKTVYQRQLRKTMDAHAAAKAAPLQRKTGAEATRRDKRAGQPYQFKSEGSDIEEGLFTRLDLSDIEVIKGVDYPKATDRKVPYDKPKGNKRNKTFFRFFQNKKKPLLSVDIDDIIKPTANKDYLKGPAFLMKFKKETKKKPQEMLWSDDFTMALNSEEPKEFFGTKEVFNRLSKEAPVDFHIFSKGIKIDEQEGYKQTVLYKIVPKRKGSKEVNSEVISLAKHVCVELASHMMGMTDNIYNHDIVTKKGRIPMTTSDTHGDEETLDKVSKLREGSTRDKDYGFNEFAFPNIGEAYATFALKKEGKGFGYHFGAVVAKSESGNTNLTLENMNRNSLLMSMQAKLFKKIKELVKEEAADFDYDNERPPQHNLAKLIQHLFNVCDETAQHMVFSINGSLNIGSTWYFGMYGRNKGSWKDVYNPYFMNNSRKNITLVMAKPEKE